MPTPNQLLDEAAQIAMVCSISQGAILLLVHWPDGYDHPGDIGLAIKTSMEIHQRVTQEIADARKEA